MKQPTIFALLALLAVACNAPNNGATPEKELPNETMQLEREPFYYENPESRTPAHSVVSEAHRLSFFGWGESNDYAFVMELPSDVTKVDRVLLEYRMGAWNKGPGEWDNTTMLFVEDKASGERYEIARAITPYGGGFGKYWNKTFWIDVTEYLPVSCSFRLVRFLRTRFSGSGM